MQQVPDVDVVLAWCRSALQALGDAREEIDAVNVFPVADSDTGTNLYLTLEAAVAAATDVAGADATDAEIETGSETGTETGCTLGGVVEAMARGAFLGARGNAGTILAQFLRGFAGVLAADGVQLSDGRTFAEGLRAGVDAAYAAVGEPVEGTMLTVSRVAADAASARAGKDEPTLVAVVRDAAAAAHRALDATTSQLEVLRRAGVVDAGGMGVAVLLDALESVLTGRWLPHERRARGNVPTIPVVAADGGDPTDVLTATTSPAYEVMYLLDAPDDRVAALRESLRPIGDSVVVAGGAGEWNVHVHVDDAGAAIEAGLAVGPVRQISVTHLVPLRGNAADAHDHAEGDHQPATARRRIVAVASGDGIAALYEQAGATVLRIDVDHRPTGADLAAALREHDSDDADEIIVLPNERDLLPVAEAAAAEVRSSDRRVAVIPTVAQVQGMAALAVHEPARAFDADVVAMTAAAGHARHGAVTIAESAGMTSAGVCAAGDVLGVVDGDFAVIGSDPVAVAVDVVGRMLAPGGELVTIVTGADESAKALADAVVAGIERDHPLVDVVGYEGGQPRYPLLLGVE